MITKSKTLKTGVEITYDRNGNIKTLYSPYMEDEIFNQPTIETDYQELVTNTLQRIWQH